MGHKLGFCDFLTLNNEYEEFLFGHYVINQMTNGKIDLNNYTQTIMMNL